MDLINTILINNKIMKLIESKYSELFPAAYITPEARYYKTLLHDTLQAQDALKQGGLSLPPEGP